MRQESPSNKGTNGHSQRDERSAPKLCKWSIKWPALGNLQTFWAASELCWALVSPILLSKRKWDHTLKRVCKEQLNVTRKPEWVCGADTPIPALSPNFLLIMWYCGVWCPPFHDIQPCYRVPLYSLHWGPNVIFLIPGPVHFSKLHCSWRICIGFRVFLAPAERFDVKIMFFRFLSCFHKCMSVFSSAT